MILRRHRNHYDVTVIYSTGMVVFGVPFGAGDGIIWLDEVECIGTEERLEDCGHNAWGIEDCTHHEDAGVRCSWAHIAIKINKDFHSCNYDNIFVKEWITRKPGSICFSNLHTYVTASLELERFSLFRNTVDTSFFAIPLFLSSTQNVISISYH